ncbi:hypothetical protein SISNIDRAFT_458814, partial [Sistotremastrum niveocremeum HHB9708]
MYLVASPTLMNMSCRHSPLAAPSLHFMREATGPRAVASTGGTPCSPASLSSFYLLND